MPEQLSPTQLSALDWTSFVDVLSGIYEHSPWIPQRAWTRRPFATLAELEAAMAAVLAEASDQEKLGLIRAHPELAGKAAIRGELTESSRQEQKGAGLDQCSPEEFERLQTANRAYGEKFGFPFIIAVKGLGRAEIIAAMESRLHRDRDTEFAEALAQIRRIASFRLADKVQDQ